MKSVCFIPVYNQIQELPLVLSELRAAPLACDTVLLVNNGSDDGSEQLIRSSEFEYLDFPQNLGIGFGFIKAIEWALARDYELFCVIAGNGKMLPVEMPRVLDPLRRGEADYVTGSRFLDDGASPNLPGFRRISIPMVTRFVNLLYGTALTDVTCGYRAYRLDLIRRARFDWKAPSLYGYGFEYFLYSKVLQDPTIRSIEVPITMRYPPQGKRYSKIKPIVGWYDMLKPWVQGRLSRGGFAASDGTSRPSA